MKSFIQTVWEKVKNIYRKSVAAIKDYFDEITHPPKIQEFAQENPEPKRGFYLGTFYLTFIGIFKTFAKIIVFGAFLAIGLGLGFSAGIMHNQPIPSVSQLDKQITNPELSSTLYYAGGSKIAKVKSDVISSEVKSSEIPTLLKKAVIATEDENFYHHSGVLPKSLIRAVFSELTGIGTSTGGSTITQQLVKMQFLTDQTTWKRKVTEMFFAEKIEKHFTKDQIISSYLNIVTFGKDNAGQNIAGIQQAASGIFGKKLEDLTLPEIAFIAGLPQSPSLYTPYTNDGKLKKNLSYGLDRKNVVLFRMYRNGDISKKQYDQARNYDLKNNFLDATTAEEKPEQNNYLYNLVTSKSSQLIADYLIKEDGEDVKKIKADDSAYGNYLNQANQLLRQKGYHVTTTINKKYYQIMSETAENYSLGQTYITYDYDEAKNEYVQTTEKAQTGAVMLDNETGKVLAFAGGVDFDTSQVNHAFSTYRSPGSSIKPYLVYAPAVQAGMINTKTALPDFPTNYGKYIPTDFGQTVENKFINADEALKMSYNLPAVSLYNSVRKSTPVQTYMNKLGFDIPKTDYEQLGIALGGTSNGFTVAQNASAFSTFENNGQRVDPYYVDKIVDPSGKTIYQHKKKTTKVFKDTTSYIMKNMLHEVVTDGTASQLSYQLNFDTDNLIGKTGTSNDFRDVWFNGSTPGVTISSWAGYDNYYGHSYNLSEDSSALNLSLWSSMTNKLYEANPKQFKLDQKNDKPSGVYEHKVLSSTGTRPGTVIFDKTSYNLTGTLVKSLSVNRNSKAATADFSYGASQKDYQLFYDYLSGIENNYGVRLKYTGATISDNNNLEDLFVVSDEKDLNQNYYGQNSKTDDAEVKDNENQDNGAGTPPDDTTGDNQASSSSSSTPTNPNQPSTPETPSNPETPPTQ